MKILILLLGVCVPICVGSLFRERVNENAEKGTCLSSSYPELGPMKYGEKKDVPNKCIRIICSSDGSIEGQTCGSVGVPPGCVLTDYDYSKPYSECCPTIKCKD